MTAPAIPAPAARAGDAPFGTRMQSGGQVRGSQLKRRIATRLPARPQAATMSTSDQSKLVRCPRTYSGRPSVRFGRSGSYDGRCAQLGRSVRTVGCFTDGHGRAARADCPGLTRGVESSVHPCVPARRLGYSLARGLACAG